MVFVFLSGTGHEGTILYDGRQICGQNWTQTNAKVYCRQLHPNSSVIAALLRRADSKDGEGNTDKEDGDDDEYSRNINLEFDCDGTEKSLSECPHRVSSQPCGSSSPASAKCMWNETVELRNKNKNNNNNHNGHRSSKGALFIGSLPVCGSHWSQAMSLAVCRRLDGASSGVLKTEYRSLKAQPSHTSPTLSLICRMKSDAEEKNISGKPEITVKDRFMDCDVEQLETAGSCTSKNQPWIVCSPCNDASIFDHLTETWKWARDTLKGIDEAMNVFKTSKAWLKEECRISECSGKKPFREGCDKCKDDNNNDDDNEDGDCGNGRSWLTKAGLKCELEKRDNPQCAFDLALDMMMTQRERVEREIKPDQIPDISREYGEELQKMGKIEGLWSIRKSWRVEPDLIALLEFWSFINGNPTYQPLWLKRLEKFDQRLESGKIRQRCLWKMFVVACYSTL